MINTYDVQIAHPEIFKQLSVGDMLSLHYRCPQVEKQMRFFTHFNEVIYTLNGIRTLSHGDKSFQLTENNSLFIRKSAYKQQLHDVAGWEVLAFYFNDDFLRQVFREYRQHLPVKNLPPVSADMLFQVHVNEITRTFFYSIVPYFTQDVPPSESLLELKFKELLFHIFSDPDNAGVLAYVSSINDLRVTPVWEVMDANYMFNLSIAEFAKMSQRSVTTFKKDFLDYYKTTPGKWLTQKRLDHAKMLLSTSKQNITEVAFDSGFENMTHFSRVFKEKYGLSPLQYRKQLS